jgi:hypothetical protein
MAKSVRTTQRPPVDTIEYNTQRDRLIISEYGRAIHKMVQRCIEIEDRDLRTRVAASIVNAMSLLNPQLKETADYKHKLWDHLYIISDFKLDVDAPFPVPARETMRLRPHRIAYPSGNIRYKYYGKTTQEMIHKIGEMEEGQQREIITRNLANFMKMSYLTWNKDTVDDETILSHLEELSDGKLRMSETARLNHTAEILALSKEKVRESAGSNKNNKGRMMKKKRKK